MNGVPKKLLALPSASTSTRFLSPLHTCTFPSPISWPCFCDKQPPVHKGQTITMRYSWVIGHTAAICFWINGTLPLCSEEVSLDISQSTTVPFIFVKPPFIAKIFTGDAFKRPWNKRLTKELALGCTMEWSHSVSSKIWCCLCYLCIPSF